MKYTDFSDVDSGLSDKISDLVQNCSFFFKTWQQVLAHTVFQNSFLEQLQPAQVLEESPELNDAATALKDNEPVDEREAAARLDMVPLQESTILFEAAECTGAAQSDDEQNLIDDGLLLGSCNEMEESKMEESYANSCSNVTSSAA